MFKTLAASVFFVLAAGCYAPDLFSPYMAGVEAARSANEADRLRAIDYDIKYYNTTGDLTALCHATMLGSRDAADYLKREHVGCRTFYENGRQMIRAAYL
ncbi:MAG: hypothetical protein LBO05_11230 [Deltaproteobacteria bacterium]|jgi:hypothetical protein|nr:hypothetical protein [Deltaproteobacteria bacterium]